MSLKMYGKEIEIKSDFELEIKEGQVFVPFILKGK